MYYLGQFFGLLATACCLVVPLLQKKGHMLLLTAAANGFFALNLLFLQEIGSGIVIHCVAVAQALITLVHLKKDLQISKAENVLFFVAYVGFGMLGFSKPLDLLPVVGAVFNMLATFQRSEQKTRYLLLINASIYSVYFGAIGSTSLLAELCAIATNLVAIVQYRRKQTA